MVDTDAETATSTATDTKTEIDTGAMATNDQSDQAPLSKVIRVDHCSDGDGSRMQGGRSLLARATGGVGRDWDQPLGIRNKKKKKSLDGDTEWEWPGS
jgi:hypothetical protein